MFTKHLGSNPSRSIICTLGGMADTAGLSPASCIRVRVQVPQGVYMNIYLHNIIMKKFYVSEVVEMGYIYIIKNTVNDKVYIGQTTQTIERRWNQHISKSKDLSCNSILYKEIRRIGIENFSIHMLEKCYDNELDNKEKYYINKYNSYINGYNSTLGGFGGTKYKLDDDVIISMYNTFSMRYIAEIYGCNTCVIKSILIKNDIKLREYNNDNIEVSLLDNNYDIIINFESKKFAWKWLILNYRSNIKASEAYTYIKRACEFGNTAFGYKWMYTRDIDVNNKETILYNRDIQIINKIKKQNNSDKGTKSLSIRNCQKNYTKNKSGRPGKRCRINTNNTVYEFEPLKDCIKFICELNGEYNVSDKQLRSRAYNMTQSISKGIKYKGIDIDII